jgi:murein L,D-transpeptidase YafK
MYNLKIIKFIGILVLFLVAMSLKPVISFKSEQKKFKRVKAAYGEKESTLKEQFLEKKLNYSAFSMILVGIKQSKELKVYIKNKDAKKYALLKTYEFCVLSGELGPKRIEGDGQVPEGLYEISNFNPESNYHLSLKVNYPNSSDKILSNKAKPGGDIYIHGNCVSIGCIPITDDLIKELYVLCIETKNQGHSIPCYIFPFEMTEKSMNLLKTADVVLPQLDFWKNLEPAYTYFTKNKTTIPFTIDKKGKYHIKE